MLSRARKEKVYYTATVYSLCSIYSAIQSPSELACTSHTCAELCSHSANMDPLVSLDYDLCKTSKMLPPLYIIAPTVPGRQGQRDNNALTVTVHI